LEEYLLSYRISFENLNYKVKKIKNGSKYTFLVFKDHFKYFYSNFHFFCKLIKLLIKYFVLKLVPKLVLIKLYSEKDTVFTVARKTLPALKASAYRDFLEILNENGLYNPENHNKSELIYSVGNSIVEFISVDNFDKVKGRKRDYLIMNEANEMSFYDFTQLSIRTKKQIFMDYNPSHSSEHWIEEKIKTRDDTVLIHSTYKDNPFLDKELIFEIERLKETDPNLWRIYGLGELGIATARVYSHFQMCDSLPENYTRRVFGIDFGFNAPTAVGEVREKDDDYYIKELVYEKGLTNSDLITRLEELGVSKTDEVFCDSAEPQRIEELQRAGYNAKSSNKDVFKGIDTVKSKKIFLTKDSVNAWREYGMYSYKTTADGKILEDVVKANDHFMDGGIRYPIHSMQNQSFVGFI
jgi:phage terminase large subunit